MMKRISMILFAFSLFMLAACGSSTTSTGESETNEEQAMETEESTGKQENEEADEEESDDKDSASSTGAKKIWKDVAKAMSKVNGMALEGRTESNTDMSGIEMNETSVITGEVTLDPFAQHLITETTSPDYGTGSSEIYTADEKVYMSDPSTGWMVMSIGLDGFSSVLTESHFENYSKHHEIFELSEDDENFYLSFNASEDVYKDVVYGGLKELWGQEAYEALIDIFDDISGSYEMTIDKQTFYVVSMTYDTKTTVSDGFVVENHATYEYSKFNEIDKVTVPQEVVDNAQSLEDMGSFENME